MSLGPAERCAKAQDRPYITMAGGSPYRFSHHPVEGIASCYIARRIHLLAGFAPDVTIELVSIPVRVEQSSLKRIKSVMRFLAHIFHIDRAFLMGEVARLDAG